MPHSHMLSFAKSGDWRWLSAVVREAIEARGAPGSISRASIVVAYGLAALRTAAERAKSGASVGLTVSGVAGVVAEGSDAAVVGVVDTQAPCVALLRSCLVWRAGRRAQVAGGKTSAQGHLSPGIAPAADGVQRTCC